MQELFKGTATLHVIPGNCEGGWGYNDEYTNWLGLLPDSVKTNSYTDAQLTQSPIFRPFDDTSLHGTNVVSLTLAQKAKVLGDGIPALSFAAGANPFGPDTGISNLNMTDLAIVVLFTAFATMGIARFSVVVIDEYSKNPIEGVPIIGCFTSRYMRWDGKASVDDVQSGKTDKKGCCKFLGKTNTGEACTRVRRYASYYDSEILHIPYTNTDCVVRQPIWKLDNVVVTLILQKVEHPIPLFVKVARLKVDSNKITDNQGRFAYDLMESAWLPPFGNGKHADIDFSCLPREQLEDGKNFNHTAPRYRNPIRVEFTGEDNGTCEMPTTSATLKIRTAPRAEGC